MVKVGDEETVSPRSDKASYSNAGSTSTTRRPVPVFDGREDTASRDIVTVGVDEEKRVGSSEEKEEKVLEEEWC